MTVFHSEFDIFDQLVNNLAGKGSVHTANGIMMQELASDQQPSSFQVPQISKDKKRSLVQDVTKQLEECYITNRRSPKMVVKHMSVPGGE